jgi:hypothetical protein
VERFFAGASAREQGAIDIEEDEFRGIRRKRKLMEEWL